MRWIAAGVAVAALSILMPPVAARAGTAEVAIENFTFDPPELTVKVGEKVIWRNADDIPHQVVESSHVYKSPALDTGDSFSMTFAAPGTSEYFCGLHPHMRGKIIIEP